MAVLVLGACSPRPGEEGAFADAIALSEAVPGCPVDTLPMHTSPEALLVEHAARDTAGQVDEAWLGGALTCGERLTSDVAHVVTGYEVHVQQVERDSAVASIRYLGQHALLWVGDSLSLEPVRDSLAERIVLRRTNRGWRIDWAPAGAHLSPSRALQRMTRLTHAARRGLEGMVARPGA